MLSFSYVVYFHSMWCNVYGEATEWHACCADTTLYSYIIVTSMELPVFKFPKVFVLPKISHHYCTLHPWSEVSKLPPTWQYRYLPITLKSRVISWASFPYLVKHNIAAMLSFCATYRVKQSYSNTSTTQRFCPNLAPLFSLQAYIV